MAISTRFIRGLSCSLLLGIASAGLHAQDKAPKAVPVIVSELKQTLFADEIEALGTLRANESVDITSPVTEIVTEVTFEDSETVSKGDVLIKMDTSEEQAELIEQRALVKDAQARVDRLSPLKAQGAASVSDYDEAKRTLDAAEARLKAIQSRIDQRVITAPFDGVLGLRNISVGGLVQPGDMITTIDDVSMMKLDISVPELFLASLTAGVEIEARTAALPDRVFKGKLASVDSRIDPVTRSIRARAFIPNHDQQLKPGLLMTVDLQKNPRMALLIPEEAIISDANKHFVFVIAEKEGGQQAIKTEVVIGARRLGQAEVIKGLFEGEKVVTHGIIRIRDGSIVTIKGDSSQAKATADLIKATPNDSV